MKRLYSCFIVVAVFAVIVVQSSTVFAASNLEEGIKELAQQISKNMTETGKKKIAVVEFTNLDGTITAFGQHLAEELITELFLASPGQFEVVERRQLMKVLEEQRLTMSGLFDAKAMESVGKILGIDAIVTGSISDLGNDVKVNARLIGVDTARVLAVARTSIPKIGIVEKLMEKEVETTLLVSGDRISIASTISTTRKTSRKNKKPSFKNNFVVITVESLKKSKKGDSLSAIVTYENISEKSVSFTILQDNTYLTDENAERWSLKSSSGIRTDRGYSTDLDSKTKIQTLLKFSPEGDTKGNVFTLSIGHYRPSTFSAIISSLRLM